MLPHLPLLSAAAAAAAQPNGYCDQKYRGCGVQQKDQLLDGSMGRQVGRQTAKAREYELNIVFIKLTDRVVSKTDIDDHVDLEVHARVYVCECVCEDARAVHRP